MSTSREGKLKNVAIEPKALSCQEKKNITAKKEEVLKKEIKDLNAWIDMIDAMTEEQLREYLQNRPEDLKTVKIQRSKPKQKFQRAGKSKSSTSNGTMASVWKFHKEDDEEC